MGRHRLDVVHPAPDGFALVEVLVALALLGGVLISAAGLLAIGGRQVDSGRHATEALAVARDVIETLQDVGFHRTYGLFGHDGSDAIHRVDSRSQPIASEWQATVERALGDGHVEIVIESIVPAGSAPPLHSARAIRCTATVVWREHLRSRHVRLATVRW